MVLNLNLKDILIYESSVDYSIHTHLQIWDKASVERIREEINKVWVETGFKGKISDTLLDTIFCSNDDVGIPRFKGSYSLVNSNTSPVKFIKKDGTEFECSDSEQLNRFPCQSVEVLVSFDFYYWHPELFGDFWVNGLCILHEIKLTEEAEYDVEMLSEVDTDTLTEAESPDQNDRSRENRNPEEEMCWLSEEGGEKMRKWTAKLTCTKCGKTFGYEMGDAIMPEDRKMLENPLCRICRFTGKLKIKH
ncbi:MAG: hypothetical protein IKH13_01610 [Clostridia bacterium]|nr:hypothetical protein [Clostridia bacterium]